MSLTLPSNNGPLAPFAKSPDLTMSQPPSARSHGNGALIDRVFSALALGAALLTLLLLVAILGSLVVGAWPAIDKYGLGFLTNTTWDPVKEDFGGLVMIYGTVATSLIALLIAVPVSFGIALFLTELSPAWLKRPLGTAIELLAAVPSIVYGMWGLLVFSPVLSTWVQQPLQHLNRVAEEEARRVGGVAAGVDVGGGGLGDDRLRHGE